MQRVQVGHRNIARSSQQLTDPRNIELVLRGIPGGLIITDHIPTLIANNRVNVL